MAHKKKGSRALVPAKDKALAKKDEVLIGGKPATKAFVAKAEKVDGQLIATIVETGKAHVRLARLLREVKANSYHLVLGFPNFGDYVKERLGVSAAQAFASMRVYRELTEGEGAKVSEDDLGNMTMQNAEALVKVKQAGKAITPRMIEAAKTMPERRFQAEIVMPTIKPSAVEAPAPVALIRVGPYHLSKEVAELFDRALEIARWVARDSQRDVTAQEKAIEALSSEFIATYEAEFEAAMKQEREDAEARAVTSQASEQELDRQDGLDGNDDEEYAQGREGGPAVDRASAETGKEGKAAASPDQEDFI